MNVRKHSLLLVSLACLGAGAADPQTKIGEYWPTIAPVVVPADNAFSVLLIEETDERQSLTPGQREILLGSGPGTVREYCLTHAVKVDGNPEFRMLDKDDDVSRESAKWQDAWKRPHTPLPYIIASNGKQGFAEPLLPDVDPVKLLARLRKLGGP